MIRTKIVKIKSYIYCSYWYCPKEDHPEKLSILSCSWLLAVLLRDANGGNKKSADVGGKQWWQTRVLLQPW
jgi:hypothetical protein